MKLVILYPLKGGKNEALWCNLLVFVVWLEALGLKLL